jgi:hypothetical protein
MNGGPAELARLNVALAALGGPSIDVSINDFTKELEAV